LKVFPLCSAAGSPQPSTLNRNHGRDSKAGRDTVATVLKDRARLRESERGERERERERKEATGYEPFERDSERSRLGSTLRPSGLRQQEWLPLPGRHNSQPLSRGQRARSHPTTRIPAHLRLGFLTERRRKNDATIARELPETLNPKPETRNPKPETRNPEPETRNPKPGTRNPKPETRNSKPETRNPEP